MSPLSSSRTRAAWDPSETPVPVAKDEAAAFDQCSSHCRLTTYHRWSISAARMGGGGPAAPACEQRNQENQNLAGWRVHVLRECDLSTSIVEQSDDARKPRGNFEAMRILVQTRNNSNYALFQIK